MPQFPQHCPTFGGLAGRTIHWLAMPVICISYFQIPRSPGNSHPSTAPPTHHKYLPIQLDFAAQFSPHQIQIQKKVHERQNQVQVLLHFCIAFVMIYSIARSQVVSIAFIFLFSNKPGPTFNSSSNFFPPFSLSLPPLLVARMPDALQWKCREENASSSLTAKV